MVRHFEVLPPKLQMPALERVKLTFSFVLLPQSMSPDERRLFVNVRAWPEGALPALNQPPPIATAIDMHEVDVETLEPTGRVSVLVLDAVVVFTVGLLQIYYYRYPLGFVQQQHISLFLS